MLEDLLKNHDWHSLEDENRGLMAETLLSDTLILQKRPIKELARWQAIIETIERFPSSALLRGADYEIIETTGSCFWTLSPRIDSPDDSYPIYTRRKNYELTWKDADKMWPTALETVRLIRSVPKENLPLPIYRDSIPFLPGKHWSQEHVKEILHSGFGFDIVAPPEPEPAYVLAHNDVIIKNMIHNGQGGYCLIDWEGLGVSPGANELATWFAFILPKTPASEWVDRVTPYIGDCCEITGLTESEWLAALGWVSMREIAVWGRKTPTDRSNIAEKNIVGVQNIFKAI